MGYIKNKIRRWLRLDKIELEIRRLDKLNADLVNIGVDVHFKHPHMVLVYSRLNGGQLRHIDINFSNLNDLEFFVKETKRKYNTEVETWDLPHGVKHLR